MVLHMYQKEIDRFDIRKIVNEVIARRDSRNERFGLLQVLTYWE